MLPTFKNILYATDLGHHAPEVFRYALSVARQYGGKIHVVHAVEPLTPLARSLVDLHAHGELTAEQEKHRWEELHGAIQTRLGQFCQTESCAMEGGEELVEGVMVLQGKPAEVVLAEARRLPADVIVMGSHGHGTVGEILLGSTAHRVVQKAHVPVLLVRIVEGEKEDGF